MKQTAIDFLLEELYKLTALSDFLDQDDFIKARTMIFEKAKAMEKQQLCYFYIKGAEAELNNPYITNIEFYNQTFKSE